jgi:hypothetical protein
VPVYFFTALSMSLKKISPYAAGEILVIFISPLIYDIISSVIALSASVKVKASTTYCSTTGFSMPSSIIF